MADGKDLERFVAEVEKAALPLTAKVTSNVLAYSDDGAQIAEFDIVVEGKVGTLEVRYLIECRDRPSQGAAPNSWIEQLAARKTRHGFDRVLAVSTTGFAAGVASYAEQQRVELRAVEKFDSVELASMIHIGETFVYTPALEMTYWLMPFEGELHDHHEAIIKKAYALGPEKALISSSGFEPMPFSEIVRLFLKSEGQLDEAMKTQTAVDFDQVFQRPRADPLFLTHEGERIPLDRMRAEGKVWFNVEPGNISKELHVYKDSSGRVIAEKISLDASAHDLPSLEWFSFADVSMDGSSPESDQKKF